MARIRNIKPEFFLNEELAELTPEARLAFIGLWTLADWEGRMQDRPKRMRMELFPYHPDTDMEQILSSLESSRFILRYAVEGERYIQVVNFKKHQYISGKEKIKPSTLPEPPQNHTGTRLEQDRNDTDINPAQRHYTTPHHSGQLTTEERSSCSEVPEAPSEPAEPHAVWKPSEAKKFRTDPGPYNIEAEDIAVWLPCVACRDERGWPLTRLHLRSLLDSYQPALDGPALAREIKAAKAWLENNPSNRKHPKGMPAFLNNWISKSVNRGAR